MDENDLFPSGFRKGDRVVVTHPELPGVEVRGVVSAEILTVAAVFVTLEGTGQRVLVHADYLRRDDTAENLDGGGTEDPHA